MFFSGLHLLHGDFYILPAVGLPCTYPQIAVPRTLPHEIFDAVGSGSVRYDTAQRDAMRSFRILPTAQTPLALHENHTRRYGKKRSTSCTSDLNPCLRSIVTCSGTPDVKFCTYTWVETQPDHERTPTGRRNVNIVSSIVSFLYCPPHLST